MLEVYYYEDFLHRSFALSGELEVEKLYKSSEMRTYFMFTIH